MCYCKNYIIFSWLKLIVLIDCVKFLLLLYYFVILFGPILLKVKMGNRGIGLCIINQGIVRLYLELIWLMSFLKRTNWLRLLGRIRCLLKDIICINGIEIVLFLLWLQCFQLLITVGYTITKELYWK